MTFKEKLHREWDWVLYDEDKKNPHDLCEDLIKEIQSDVIKPLLDEVEKDVIGEIEDEDGAPIWDRRDQQDKLAELRGKYLK